MLFIVCLFFYRNSVKCAHRGDIFDTKVDLTESESDLDSIGECMSFEELIKSAILYECVNPDVTEGGLSSESRCVSSGEEIELSEILQNMPGAEEGMDSTHISTTEPENGLLSAESSATGNSNLLKSSVSSIVSEIIDSLSKNLVIENNIDEKPVSTAVSDDSLKCADTLDSKNDESSENNVLYERNLSTEPSKSRNVMKKEEGELAGSKSYFNNDDEINVLNECEPRVPKNNYPSNKKDAPETAKEYIGSSEEKFSISEIDESEEEKQGFSRWLFSIFFKCVSSFKFY